MAKSTKYSTAKVNILRKVVALEKKVRKNTAEVKFKDTNLSNVLTPTAGGLATNFYLTDIAQGPSKGERIGDKIRILKVEVRGTTSTVGLDLYLCKNRTGAPISSSMFATSSAGTFLETNDFVEYHHEGVGLKSAGPVFRFAKSFGSGLVNSYNLPDSTSLQSNRLMFVLRNPFDSAGWVNATARVWYTDA